MYPLSQQFKFMAAATAGFCAAIGIMSIIHVNSAYAVTPAPSGISLTAIVARLDADEATIAELKNDQKAGPAGPQGLKGDTGAAGAGFTPGNLAAISTITKKGTDLTISGVNVHIVDGSGSTGSKSGLGNLTIGYNELRGDGSDNRTGSHNLILGARNNYVSSSGIVGGLENTISGRFASAIGGDDDVSSGRGSVTTGGSSNVANAFASSVTGGSQNSARGDWSSVSGGNINTASGQYSSVAGGAYSTASGDESFVGGGSLNSATGTKSSVSGGEYNTAVGR